MKKKEMERIVIDKANIDSIEEDIIIRRGIERYMYVRQFVYGNVLDIACGEGYGSYLMSKNPDVLKITSVDRSEKAIADAKENFSRENIEYIVGSPETVNGKFDVLVSLETVEHLSEPAVLKEMTVRCDIPEVIISFPRKKTTHYNKYHLWDFTKEDILRLFEGYECYRVYDIHDSTIMNFVRINRSGYTMPKKYWGRMSE
ncbi:MAG: class I SAM-dependent methyltransferase [Lachnospiraceae bacterium]|nr:class I SAM-dependent methyltransferase [Lachnospiraceae bacterium]